MTSTPSVDLTGPHPGSLLDLVPVVPVVVVDELDQAVPLARALLAGGVPVVELTLRTDVALEAVAAIAAAVPEVVVGAGTVLSAAQAEEARDAGAQFLVSPGATPTLLAGMTGTGLPFLAGTSTVSEVLAVLETGVREMKFFPAEVSGGVAYLKALAGPVPAARLCPTGGVTAASASSYLSLPNVGCVGGTWITPPALLREGRWDEVSSLAAATLDLRVAPVDQGSLPEV